MIDKVRISFLIGVDKKENIVSYEGIGNIHYAKHPRARNLSIRINAKGKVRVSMPRHVSFRKAERFVLGRAPWIRGKLEQIREKVDSQPVLREGDYLQLREKALPLSRKHKGEDLEEVVWRLLLQEGKAYLPGRVAQLASLQGLKYSQVRVRRMQSRWGSCSASNNINLNSWLMMLPEHLSDYVILHELAHTVHKNHSSRFWQLLDDLTGGSAMALRKELRDRQIMGLRLEEEGA